MVLLVDTVLCESVGIHRRHRVQQINYAAVECVEFTCVKYKKYTVLDE